MSQKSRFHPSKRGINPPITGGMFTAQTIRGLQHEAVNARRHFPANTHLAVNCCEFADELKAMLHQHTAGSKHDARQDDRRMTVVQIVSKAYQVAALALRIAEEGDAEHAFGRPVDQTPFTGG